MDGVGRRAETHWSGRRVHIEQRNGTTLLTAHGAQPAVALTASLSRESERVPHTHTPAPIQAEAKQYVYRVPIVMKKGRSGKRGIQLMSMSRVCESASCTSKHGCTVRSDPHSSRESAWREIEGEGERALNLAANKHKA